jgi:hypothetical protein
MNKKIVKLHVTKKDTKKEKITEKLRLKYPRLERNEDREIIPPEEEKCYSPNLLLRERIRLSNTLADEGYVKWDSFYLDILLGNCLNHVMYRALKTVYGFPDVLTSEVIEKTSEDGNIPRGALPIEWGYLLQGKGGSCYEIEKRYREAAPNIILWLPHKMRPEEMPPGMVEGLLNFLDLFSQLVKIVDYNYSIKEEQKKFSEVLGWDHLPNIHVITNLYNQNFQAGREMIELAEELLPKAEDLQQDLLSKGRWIEASNIGWKRGTLYVSAIVFFLMALEGFVNLLFKFFLKPQFKYEKYERSTSKADFDLRILHLPVYCKGFSNADITPDDTAYKQWSKINHFRNDLLHANITEENEQIGTFEDCFTFTYDPLLHLKNKQKKEMHTRHSSIDKDDAVRVQQIVEQIVAEIIEKMDEKEKAWVRSWIGEIDISWFPGIEDKDYAVSLNVSLLNDKTNGE